MADWCPRQIVFTIPGSPAVQVTATEDGLGNIQFSVDMLNTKSIGDLRGLFFDFNESHMSGLNVSGSSLITTKKFGANSVIDLGNGDNLNGATKLKFDVGLEFGNQGKAKGEPTTNQTIDFTLSNTSHNLTLDDIAHMRFGAVTTANGSVAGGSKNITVAPAAPDAHNDAWTINEDNSASATHTPLPFTMDVLANDTDADPGDVLVITELHNAVGPGTFAISGDGHSIIYTPLADYAGGPVQVDYCVSDGHGGEDHATAVLNFIAVADDPALSFAVAQGANINQTLITVTADQTDADGSENITGLTWAVNGGGAPAGTSIVAMGPATGVGTHQLTQTFVVDTAAAQDWLFNIDFTATSKEVSNTSTETNTATKTIDIDYTSNHQTLSYVVDDQSIWSTGDAFEIGYNDFLGIDKSVSATIGDDTITGTYVKGDASLKAGFDVHSSFNGGTIDATIPIDVTVNTTYNKTTDNVYVDPSLSLGSGVTFDATGPEGYFKLDFIFEASAHLTVDLLWVDIYNDGFSQNWDQNLVNFDSSDPASVYTIPGGLVDIGYEWPHLNVTGGTSGSDTSNNFLFATLDVDQLANYLSGGLFSFLDADPNDAGNFELLDFDITGGLNLMQSLALGLSSTSSTVTLEDGTVVPLTFGTSTMITNVSQHDTADAGTTVGMSFAIDPNVTLHNNTELGGTIDGELWIPKNFDETLYHNNFNIVSGPLFTLFDDTFALNGVGSQDFAILV